jgi:hypothetical protein
MKLFDFRVSEDFGKEYIFTLLKGKKRSFFQLSLDWHEYPSGVYLQIEMGNNRLLDILFWCWKVGFSFSLFDITRGSLELSEPLSK